MTSTTCKAVGVCVALAAALGTWGNKGAQAQVYYLPADDCTCVPAYETRVYYAPQPTHRTVWRQVPVTAYRPIAYLDPWTGCQVVQTQPVTTTEWRAYREALPEAREESTVYRPIFRDRFGRTYREEEPDRIGTPRISRPRAVYGPREPDVGALNRRFTELTRRVDELDKWRNTFPSPLTGTEP